jgi:hypothetical protein
MLKTKSKHNIKEEISLLSDDKTNDAWYPTIVESMI